MPPPGGFPKDLATETWSQMMTRIPGQGVAASSGGSITSEASTMEVQEPGVTSPPPAYPTGLHQLEPTSPGGSTDWGITSTLRWSSQNQETNCRPTGPRPTGPNTTNAGTEHSSGNAADPSAEAVPTSCSISAGGTAGKSAHYPISAGHAAT